MTDQQTNNREKLLMWCMSHVLEPFLRLAGCGFVALFNDTELGRLLFMFISPFSSHISLTFVMAYVNITAMLT